MTAFKCEDCEKIRADVKEAVTELKSENTNKVLEDIKAEIQAQIDVIPWRNTLYQDGQIEAFEYAIEIIDKHISGKGQE